MMKMELAVEFFCALDECGSGLDTVFFVFDDGEIQDFDGMSLQPGEYVELGARKLIAEELGGRTWVAVGSYGMALLARSVLLNIGNK